MKKNTFVKVDEHVYTETLDNGIDVYLYSTKKSKNFYISISVKYGARVTSYNINNEITKVIPGSAHFLEHKVMAISENETFTKKLNEYGSYANAWTSNYGTNYNIFGSENIIENIKLLFDIFYNTDINDKNVEEEKGIIGEEIDMYDDKIPSFMYYKTLDNLFHDSFAKNTETGTREDISKITSSSLNKIYNDYYKTNNTFIVICGNFNKEDVLSYIKSYMKNINNKGQIPERIIPKEPQNVLKEYEELDKNLEENRINIAYKMKKDVFGIEDDNILYFYIQSILNSYIGSSSKKYESYKEKYLFTTLNYNITLVDDYLVIMLTSTTSNKEKYIDTITKDIKNIKITKDDFERSKKCYLKTYITDFDNIENIEYNIANSIFMDGKVNYDEYDDLMKLSFEKTKDIISKMNFDNKSILVIK